MYFFTESQRGILSFGTFSSQWVFMFGAVSSKGVDFYLGLVKSLVTGCLYFDSEAI